MLAFFVLQRAAMLKCWSTCQVPQTAIKAVSPAAASTSKMQFIETYLSYKNNKASAFVHPRCRLRQRGFCWLNRHIIVDSVTRDSPSIGGGANAPVEGAGCYRCMWGGATTARQREGSPPATQKGGVATACVGETRCEYVNQPGSEYLLASPSLYSTAQFHLDLQRHLRILILKSDLIRPTSLSSKCFFYHLHSFVLELVFVFPIVQCSKLNIRGYLLCLLCVLIKLKDACCLILKKDVTLCMVIVWFKKTVFYHGTWQPSLQDKKLESTFRLPPHGADSGRPKEDGQGHHHRPGETLEGWVEYEWYQCYCHMKLELDKKHYVTSLNTAFP